MSKPIYVGCVCSDLSRLTMLEFHYNVIEQHFKNKHTVPYCDTDSLFSNLKHPDIYEWMKETNQYFDFSDYTREDMHSDENKKHYVALKMN